MSKDRHWMEKTAGEELIPDANEHFEVDESQADLLLDGVFKQYSTGQKAVRGISLTALRGQVTVLLGHNGAGKTTTFSMISGMEEPSSGTVKICGYPAGSRESKYGTL